MLRHDYRVALSAVAVVKFFILNITGCQGLLFSLPISCTLCVQFTPNVSKCVFTIGVVGIKI